MTVKPFVATHYVNGNPYAELLHASTEEAAAEICRRHGWELQKVSQEELDEVVVGYLGFALRERQQATVH